MFCFSETGPCHIAQAGLELKTQPRLALSGSLVLIAIQNPLNDYSMLFFFSTLPIDRHLGCLEFGPMMNKATTDT
jgi:hypothetical protein